jgi:hypothetical protein
MITNRLVFNEETHTYKLDGVIIPSVTQILNESGLVNLDWIDADLLAETADLGQKVHSTTELYDTQDLDFNKLHPTLKNYLDGWIKFKKDYDFIPMEIEMQLSHPVYRYAGRIDRVGFIGKDLTVVDIKSGTKQKVHALQTAGYKCLYDVDKKKIEQIKRRICVYLNQDGYEVEEYKSAQDINVFLSALTITNYKRGVK